MPGLDVVDVHESDSSDNDENHSKLLSAVSLLDCSQRVELPKRTEPSTKVSEFNLSSGDSKKFVTAEDLAKSFFKKDDHVAIIKELKEISKSSKTLPKPLEKPTEERLKRSVGFEKVKKDLGKWNAIVTRNALSDRLHFPLNNSSIKLQDSKEFLSHFKTKTPLEEEIEKILQEDVQNEEDDKDEEFPLTLEEMMEKRKEMAQLRAKLSYKQAKAQRQSKIKSKKYHRLLKREKLREQLKEFEILQKTDPEAALKKLSELDKTRAQERASLRHRNTGQWAKNLTVKAKYDVETRKVLAEQLKMSRELTQKVSQGDSSDSEEGEKADENDPPARAPKTTSGENPWALDVSEEVQDFVSGYRKFWNEKNKSAQEPEAGENEGKREKAAKRLSPTAEEPINNKQTETADSKGSEKTGNKSPTANKSKESSSKQQTKTADSKEMLNGGDKPPKKKKRERKKKKASPGEMKTYVSIQPTSGVWIVTPVEEPTKPKEGKKRKAENIDELFERLNENLFKKAKQKAARITRRLNKAISKRKREEEDSEEEEMDLSLKNQVGVQRPDVDAGLLEGGEEEVLIGGETGKAVSGEKAEAGRGEGGATPSIDPKSFIQVKPKRLRSCLPEGDVGNEDALDDDREQQKLMEEAFVDDDVVAEFEEMKKQEEESSKVEIETTLPGWGSWTGSGVKPPRKKQLLVLNVPPRKDKQKKDVIINEKENPNLKSHLVKDVPHPFGSVEAFEAHIRAPVGREWVPETAHHKLIQKAVVTKLGSVIEPMNESEIVQLKKTWKSPYKGKVKSENK